MPTIKEITERIMVDIEDVPCNPVALYWLNKNSEYDMWIFGMTQTNGLQIKAMETFESVIQDLANTNKRSQFLTKKTVPQIVLGYDNLPTNKVEGIKGILDSVEINMLVSAPAARPCVFIKVTIDSGSWKITETENDFHSLEITINLPELFNQNK